MFLAKYGQYVAEMCIQANSQVDAQEAEAEDFLKEISIPRVLTGVHLKTRKPKPFCF